MYLIYLALAMVVIYVVCSILIMYELDRRGIKTSILWMRFLIFKYVGQYKQITLEETGHAGLLFYLWITSINLALLLVILYFISP